MDHWTGNTPELEMTPRTLLSIIGKAPFKSPLFLNGKVHLGLRGVSRTH